jgi:hypothetical protein
VLDSYYKMFGSYVYTYLIYIECICMSYINCFTALSAFGPCTVLECIREYSATDRHAAIMCMCCDKFELYIPILSNFLHPYTVHWQLKYCVKSLLAGLCE